MFLRELLYFVVAAEHLNFSEAAEQLFITKSGLSKNISKIEAELGVQLFARDKQNLTLTPAGHKFLESASRLLMDCNYLNLMSNEGIDAKQEKITIGISNHYGHYAHVHVNRFVNQVFEKEELVDLEVECLPIPMLQQEYLQGKIDFVIGNRSVMRDLPFCEYLPFLSQFRQIVLSKTHPLATADRLKLSQFKEEPFIAIDRHATPYAYDYDLKLCINYGDFFPRIVKEVSDFDTLYMTMERTNLVTITCIPPDLPTLKTVVIDEIGTCEPAVSLFVGWNERNHKSAISIVKERLATAALMQDDADILIEREV